MASRPVVRIAVMGVTGSGKSTLIRTVTGCKDIVIGKTMKSETINAKAYEVTVDNITYSLIDTPGFNDFKRSDKEILDHITQYLSTQFKAGELLSGIIYLHPISRTRFQGTDTLQASVFRELCGSETYRNVVLATTHWKDVDLSIAKAREEELFAANDLLGDMIEDGARTWRVAHNNSESCRNLIKSFANSKAAALKVQKQVSSGAESSAAAVLTAQLRKLELAHQRQVEKKERKAKAAEAKRQREMREAEERHQREVEEQERQAASDRWWREYHQQQEAERLENEAAAAREEARQYNQAANDRRREKARAEAAAREKTKREEEEKKAAEQRQRQRETEEAELRQKQEKERQRQRKIERTRAGLSAKSEAVFSRYLCRQYSIHSSGESEKVWNALRCWDCGYDVCWPCFRSRRVLSHGSDCTYYESGWSFE